MLSEHVSAVTARHGFGFGLRGGRAVPVVQLQAVVAQRLELLVVLVVADADDGHLRCTESSQAAFRHPAIALPHLHVSIYALHLPTTSIQRRFTAKTNAEHHQSYQAALSHSSSPGEYSQPGAATGSQTSCKRALDLAIVLMRSCTPPRSPADMPSTSSITSTICAQRTRVQTPM